MKVVSLDWETYYDKQYSLSKMSTSSYIRDPRFEAIGFSATVDGVKQPWFSGSHDEIVERLGPQSWWDDAIFVAHHAMFDAGIMAYRYNLRPAVLCCTLSMARSLGFDFHSGASLGGVATALRYLDPTIPHKGDEVVRAIGKRRGDFSPTELAQYGRYCDTDDDICNKIFNIMAAMLPASELRWQDIVLRMFTAPVFQLDKPLLDEELIRVRERKRALMAQLIESLGVGTEAKLQEYLGSNQKFAQVLQAIGIEPPMKVSLKTGKPAFAFAKSDAGMKDLLEHDLPVVQLLASVRLSTKSTIEESRVEKFIGLSTEGSWGIPYNVSGAHTHRLSGSDGQNPQNFPSGRIKGQTKALRLSVKAPPGHVTIAGDSAQVEARVLAYIAQQMDLLDQFAAGVDTYVAMASRIYGLPAEVILAGVAAADEVSKLQRQVGKNTRLGAGFGIGAVKFKDYVRAQTGIVLPKEVCELAISTFRQSNQMIVALWRRCDQVLRDMIQGGSGWFGGPKGDLFFYDGSRELLGVRVPGIRGPDGMWLNYPELRMERDKKTDPDTGEITERDVIVYTKAKGRGKMRAYTYGAKIVENLTQYLAFAMMKFQGHLIGKRFPVKLNSHDEHAVVVSEHVAVEAKQFIEKCMRTLPSWLEGCPINCEVGVAHRYGDC